MMVEFLDNISMQEQQAIKDWLENNKIYQCQIVKINGIDYNLMVVIENTKVVAIRAIK